MGDDTTNLSLSVPYVRILRAVSVRAARCRPLLLRRGLLVRPLVPAWPQTAPSWGPREPSERACTCSVTQLRALPPAYADIVQRAILGTGTLPQAPDALAIRTNNATVRLHRARKALRAACTLRRHPSLGSGVVQLPAIELQ